MPQNNELKFLCEASLNLVPTEGVRLRQSSLHLSDQQVVMTIIHHCQNIYFLYFVVFIQGK